MGQVTLTLKRFYSDSLNTLGCLTIQRTDVKYLGTFAAYTCEDKHNDYKIKQKTRIPAGRYRITKREEMTPLTKKYRQRHKHWGFDWHLMLENVPNYSNVYIHVGNSHEDSEGCILVGNISANPMQTNLPLQQSVGAYKTFYREISRCLANGDEVWIEIEDCDR